MMNRVANILIAGIGGASLGTEILHVITISNCDYSDAIFIAYGHYQEGFADLTLKLERYVDEVSRIVLS